MEVVDPTLPGPLMLLLVLHLLGPVLPLAALAVLLL